jgi:sugar transferase (PEP-CTERM/EpsH1 system associated)
VVPDLEGGGLQSGVINLVNNLPGDEFEHEIACLHAGGRYRSRLEPAVRVQELQAGWHDPRTPFRLLKTLHRFRPQVIHARNWSSWPDSTMARMLAGHGRLIFSLHGWDTDEPTSPLRAMGCRWLARRTDHLVSVSGHAARLFANEVGLDIGRFEIIPNGVDMRRFERPHDRTAIRRELGIDDETLLIGSVGRLEGIKDYATLLQAGAELIHHAGVACRLLLVGEGSHRASLERLAGSLGMGNRVLFTGWRDDVLRLLVAMDLFVMPSLREGMNNAILEAMATGASAVVATAVGGTPELIEDRRSGRLVPPGDRKALTQALFELARDRTSRLSLAEAARRRVSQKYSLIHTLQCYSGMYRRFAGSPGEACLPLPAPPHPPLIHDVPA